MGAVLLLGWEIVDDRVDPHFRRQKLGEPRGVGILVSPGRKVVLDYSGDRDVLPFQPLRPVDGDERDGVLPGQPGRVQLIGRFILHGVEILEKRLHGRPPLQRTPVVGEIQETIDIQPRRQSGVRWKSLDVLPSPSSVQDQPADLDERQALALGQNLPVDRSKPLESRQRRGSQFGHLLGCFDGLDEGYRVGVFGVIFEVVGVCYPPRQLYQVCHAQVKSRSKENLSDRCGVLGMLECGEPGPHLGDLGNGQKTSDIGHLYRYVVVREGVENDGKVLVLPEEDSHVSPAFACVVEGLEARGNPIGFCNCIPGPTSDHFSFGRHVGRV